MQEKLNQLMNAINSADLALKAEITSLTAVVESLVYSVHRAEGHYMGLPINCNESPCVQFYRRGE